MSRVVFCPDDKNIMTASTASGELMFYCSCGKVMGGSPEDSLRAEEHLEATESVQKYGVFIEQSPYDLAGKKVARKCDQCNIGFMTLIYIGINETPLYTCVCGNITTTTTATSKQPET